VRIWQVGVARPVVVDGDAAPLVEFIMDRWATPTAIESSRESLDLVFEGWDDDRRELWQIPEVVSFVRELDAYWPQAGYFLSRLGHGLQVMQFCLCARGTGSIGEAKDGDLDVNMDPDALRSVLTRWMRGINHMADVAGLGQKTVNEASSSLARYLTEGPGAGALRE